jgi:uncharacterized membrane protein
MSSNPSAAPSAQSPDETIVLSGTFASGGRRVPTGNGWNWIANAWRLFRAEAGLWIGMTLALFAIFGALFALYFWLPAVSFVTMTLLWPVFTAGVVVVSRAIDQGGQARFKQLFAGFRHRLGALLVVGGIYLVANAVIAGGIFYFMGIDLSMVRFDAPPEQLTLLAAKITIAGLIVIALMLPFVMAIWFAPALVAFHAELGPVAAMLRSFLGCLKNVLPFLLYGVILAIASVIASVPAFLGWLILGPVVAASIYTAYRDIYFSA